MGTGQSKSVPPDVQMQMRLRMENGFRDDDEDIDISQSGISLRGGGGLLSDRDRGEPFTRSQSNFARFPNNGSNTAIGANNDDSSDEYFNKIYNKRVEKSVISVNGVKSAPTIGINKEKDPEVAAAIAELEETFKSVGDAPLKNENDGGRDGNSDEISNKKDNHHEHSHSDEDNGYNSRSSPESSSDTSSQAMTMTNNSNNGQGQSSLDRNSNYNEQLRRHSNHLDLSRTQFDGPNNGGFSRDGSNGSGRTPSNPQVSRGGGGGGVMNSEQRLLISSYGGGGVGNSKMVRNISHNCQSILVQQRREFQNHQRRNTRDGGGSNMGSRSRSSREISNNEEKEENWTYEPPKIDGFDVSKFKEVNSKVAPAVKVIHRRDEEDKGYYSQSPDVPSYTKDELDLIASLEREVY